MKNIKSIAVGLYLVIAALGIATNSAKATLLELDLNAPADNLITLDTLTGLEWLDVTATLGQSFNQAASSIFVTTQGFRHANQAEVLQLFQNFGATDINTANAGTPLFPGNFAPGVNFLNLLGCTGQCSSTTFAFNTGLFAGGTFPATGAFVAVNTDDSTAAFTLEQGAFGLDSNPGGLTGNFLVRETLLDLPEPGTLAILGLGLVGLGYSRLRKKA
jgi:hypothetical protein